MKTENYGFNNLKEQDAVYDEKNPSHFYKKLIVLAFNFVILCNCLIKPGSFIDCTVKSLIAFDKGAEPRGNENKTIYILSYKYLQ